MTTSTDNTKKQPKPKKPKGPIRTEAVVPAIILTVLIGVYFTMFFDGHLRRGMEYVGTQVNGAEVNIGYLSTSFFGASLDMGKIQVTDKNKPERNIVQVGQIKFKMLWDALLRAKVVVDEASILNIEALAPRKSPGYVVPPPPPGKPGEGALEKAQAQVMEQTQKKLNKNFLGDIASVLGGTDPKDQLKNLQGNLKSDARIKELEKELKEKQAKWDKQIKELPKPEELKQYETRVKALKFDVNNPIELAKNLKEADKIIKEADAKVKQVEQTTKDVNGEVNTYTQAYKDLEKMVEQDVADMQKRFKIPSLDPKEFSQQLFMGMIEQKLVSVRKYVEMARKYAPPKLTAEQKKAKAEEQLVPPKRGDGRNFRFPITTGYPLFWLKHAAISSELGQSELSGNIKGEILNLTTDQPFIGKPTKILLAGDFPKQKVMDVDADITLDHTTDIAKDSMRVTVGNFPTGEYKISDSDDVRLKIDESGGSSQLVAALVNNEITMDVKNQFKEVKWVTEAKNKQVKDIIEAVLKGIPLVTVDAQVRGSFEDFSLHIQSNLGEELAQGFQAQLKAKIAEAQAALRKSIDDKIGAQKNKLKEEMDKTIGNLTKNLNGKKEEVDKAIKDAKAQADGAKGKGGNKKMEDEGKKLLKKLKF